MNTTTMLHIVVMPIDISEHDTSFFQGFSNQLFDEYAKIFAMLPRFPHDVLEIFLDKDEFIASKRMGSALDVYQVRVDLMDDDHLDFSRDFVTIWSTESTFEAANSILKKFRFSPIHICTSNNDKTIFIEELNANKIYSLIINIIDLVKKSPLKSDFQEFIRNLDTSKIKENKVTALPFSVRGHNCVRPMLEALQTIGFFAEEHKGYLKEGQSQHVECMLNLANFIDKCIQSINFKGFIKKNDVIVFCPSMYFFLYKNDSQLWNRFYRELSKDKRIFLKNAIIRNKGYGNFVLEKSADFFNPYDDQFLGALLKIRQSELSFFTGVVSIMAANQFCPALRWPNSAMLHHDILKNIAALIKSNKRLSLKKLNNKIKAYSDSIKRDVGVDLFNCSIQNRERILALCDFPIEWIALDHTPIMFTHEISRIPTTPGNLFSQLGLTGQRLAITYEHLTDILVLRSFGDKDPIKDHLKTAIEIFDKNKSYENLNINIVDVQCEDELINQLNAFTGLIVIFDCHGNHGGEDESGWLNIGKDKVNTWELANKCRIPPIVILSACSTHAIDGSHASVANGLFRSGALSVISTYAPIGALHAGTFVARLLYRVSAFVPLIIKARPITWREVVSGFLKMSYATDVLMGMRFELGLLSEKQYYDIHQEANMIINSYAPDWLTRFFEVIVAETEFSLEDVNMIIAENFSFVSTMLFSQLGRPENIIIQQ